MDAIPVWLAQYNKEITYTGNVDIWQYSDKGRVDGITGDVDLDDLCDLEGYGMDDDEDDDNAETIREKLAQIGVLLKEINEIL
jgi:GH25 family lysozyme M1 (1,4-beta-N-acetylmuramidase)